MRAPAWLTNLQPFLRGDHKPVEFQADCTLRQALQPGHALQATHPIHWRELKLPGNSAKPFWPEGDGNPQKAQFGQTTRQPPPTPVGCGDLPGTLRELLGGGQGAGRKTLSQVQPNSLAMFAVNGPTLTRLNLTIPVGGCHLGTSTTAPPPEVTTGCFWGRNPPPRPPRQGL